MLKYAALAVGAALLVALVFVFLPVTSGPRPPPRILSSTEPQAPTSFTVHDVPPPAPPPAAAPAPAADLDAVMQRLRNAAAAPPAPPSPIPPPPPIPPIPPAPPAAAVPDAGAPTPTPPAQSLAAQTPAPTGARWASVTGGGTRWRMARTGNGYTVSIDLGGGRVADVHVLPAFANLDPAAVNVRVDYLRDTILQNFSSQPGAYSFARDGSVSLEH